MIDHDPTFVSKTYTDSLLGDFEEFVDKNREHFIDDPDSEERVKLAYVGLVSAMGGLASSLLFEQRERATELMATYMGDVLYYLTAMCSAYGIPLDAVMDAAIEEHIADDYEGNSTND